VAYEVAGELRRAVTVGVIGKDVTVSFRMAAAQVKQNDCRHAASEDRA
jgi:hypothetical protein